MSDLTNDRIKQLAMFAYDVSQGCAPDSFFHGVYAALVELAARRQLADERKAFWSQKVINHEHASDRAGTA